MAYTEYRIDGGLWERGTSCLLQAVRRHHPGRPGDVASGQHTVEFRSTDAAGNTEAIVSRTVLLDSDPPATSDDAPVGPQNADVTVHLTATDDLSGVAHTYYRLDAGPWLEGTQVLVAAPPDGSGDGVHTIGYYSTDNAGNKEPDNTLQVQIDTQPPHIGDNISQPWYKGTVNVQLTATDSDSGVATFAYTLGDPSDPTAVWTPYTAPFDVSGEGTHTVSYYATDNVGNRTDAHAIIHIDDTARPPRPPPTRRLDQGRRHRDPRCHRYRRLGPRRPTGRSTAARCRPTPPTTSRCSPAAARH